MSAEELLSHNEKSSRTVYNEQIDGTPFRVVAGEGENNTYIVTGKWKVGGPYKNIKEAEEKLEKRDWELILNTIIVLTSATITAMQEEEKNKITDILEKDGNKIIVK